MVRKEKGLQAIREVVSDTEEESHGRLSLDRKADMLGLNERSVTAHSKRQRSVDFERESK